MSSTITSDTEYKVAMEEWEYDGMLAYGLYTDIETVHGVPDKPKTKDPTFQDWEKYGACDGPWMNPKECDWVVNDRHVLWGRRVDTDDEQCLQLIKRVHFDPAYSRYKCRTEPMSVIERSKLFAQLLPGYDNNRFTKIYNDWIIDTECGKEEQLYEAYMKE